MFDNKRFQFKKKILDVSSKIFFISSLTRFAIAVYQTFFSIFRNDIRFVDYLSE